MEPRLQLGRVETYMQEQCAQEGQGELVNLIQPSAINSLKPLIHDSVTRRPWVPWHVQTRYANVDGG